MERKIWRLPLATALTLLSGCVTVSRREGADQVEALLAQRSPTGFHWTHDEQGRAAIDARVSELVAAPLSPAAAVQLAWLRNPAIAGEYARLGIAQADVVEASRIGNPTLSGSALHDGGPSKITTGVSAPLADLLLLPSRRRFAAGEYERAQQTIASALVNLAASVEQAWYEAAGADQVAAMREAVAAAAGASADLAQRFYDAGNVSALELKLEQATATQARLTATTARAEATRARLNLSTLMGVSGSDARWTLDAPLAAPVETEDALDALQSLARSQRLDLAAARKEVTLLSDALALTRRWRLLGAVDVGVERERETDRSKLTGPTLSIALPLFNQGQAAIARAQARLEQSRAELAQLELSIDNDVRLGSERVRAMRAIAEDYRVALVPQREAVLKHQVERMNFMLIGAFELLLAKQQEYDAYQGYLEAVRDYWLARVALARAIGTRLPSEATTGPRTLGIDTILHPPAPEGGHQHHGGMNMDDMPGMNMDNMPGMQHGDGRPDAPAAAVPSDPSAAHDMSAMPSAAPASSPHAAHTSPTKPSAPNPASPSTPSPQEPPAKHDDERLPPSEARVLSLVPPRRAFARHLVALTVPGDLA